MSSKSTDAKVKCNEHQANIQRIKRLEDDRKDHADRLDKVTDDLTNCVVGINEVSASLNSFIDKFKRVNHDCDKVNAHIEDNRKKIESIDKGITYRLNTFEASVERKIQLLLGVLASIGTIAGVIIHFFM